LCKVSAATGDFGRTILRGAKFFKGIPMRNEFTAVIEQDGEWFVAYSPEVPGANGQGRTKDEARQSLADAIALILIDRREDGLRGIDANAVQEIVVVE
jgi:predicted RNase H-like HicB family nuclease